MNFLKEYESEIWGVRELHRIPRLANPEKGVLKAHMCIKSFHTECGFGKQSYADAIYLGEL